MHLAFLIHCLFAAACSPDNSGGGNRFDENAENLLGALDGVSPWLDSVGSIRPTLQADLDRIATAGIPVAIGFEQGSEVIGLPVTH